MTFRMSPRIAPWRSLGCVCVGLVLAACSSSTLKPQPAELPPNPQLFSVRQAWRMDTGPVNFPLEMRAVGNSVAVANAMGVVTMLDARTGEQLWQLALGTPLSAGVGHDGRRAAVITRENELVVMASGAELWRQRLTATSYTTPLVAGERVRSVELSFCRISNQRIASTNIEVDVGQRFEFAPGVNLRY